MPDPSFAVLADYLRAWQRGSDDRDRELVSLQLPLDRLLASPESARGAAYRVEGLLQERRAMPFPYQDLEEWFIRVIDRTPVIVYVPADQPPLSAGQPVRVDARFYKVLEARARDQQVRRYPTFIGHEIEEAMTQRRSRFAQVDILLLLGFLVLMVIVLVIVAGFARRNPGPGPLRTPRDRPVASAARGDEVVSPTANSPSSEGDHG